MRLFWDVDTQKDFIDREGSLYVDGSEAIRDNLKQIVQSVRENNELIWGSMDYHERGDEEISEDPDMEKTFPPHCLEGGDGAESIPETTPVNPSYVGSAPILHGDILKLGGNPINEVYFRKQTFDVFSNPNVEPALERLGPSQIIVFGVTLDVCVRFAVDGMLKRGYDVAVVEDAVKALDESRRNELLSGWRENGATVCSTDDVVDALNRCEVEEEELELA